MTSADRDDWAEAPVDMVLHCPKCGAQHIDAPESEAHYTERLHESAWWELGGDKPDRWTNPPHRSHLCAGCGHIWRPADVPTNGVAAVKTKGKADSPLAPPAVVAGPTRLQINEAMREAGWQNAGIRQADLDKVERVVRAFSAGTPPAAADPDAATEEDKAVYAGIADRYFRDTAPAASEKVEALQRRFADYQRNERGRLQAEVGRLTKLLNSPELHDFAKGVVLEAAHQRERWGTEHDAGKTPADWFWLVGYLAGKALHEHVAGNTEKALHHTVTAAAALANWHAAISGADTSMRPGIAAESGGTG